MGFLSKTVAVAASMGKIFGFGEAYIRWKENRPARLKDKAIEAAQEYININETNKYNGRKVSGKRRRNLLDHYKKRFDSWHDGV